MGKKTEGRKQELGHKFMTPEGGASCSTQGIAPLSQTYLTARGSL